MGLANNKTFLNRLKKRLQTFWMWNEFLVNESLKFKSAWLVGSESFWTRNKFLAVES